MNEVEIIKYNHKLELEPFPASKPIYYARLRYVGDIKKEVVFQSAEDMTKDIDEIVENLIDENKGFFTVNHIDPKKITDAQVREMLSEGVGKLQEKILVKEK